jgi:hypothetical protein
MSALQRILFYIVLPILAVLLISPAWFQSTFIYWMIPVAVLSPILGFMMLRGRSTALSLMIFLLGFNVIMRLMMFFPFFSNNAGDVDLLFVATSIASMALSTYLLLRLDRVDVRVQMVR